MKHACICHVMEGMTQCIIESPHVGETLSTVNYLLFIRYSLFSISYFLFPIHRIQREARVE